MARASAPGVLPWLVAPLAGALRNQHGHALLVQGAPGAGQFEFAIALARAWLCETAASDRTEGVACGHCESCHLASHEQVHPDLRVLLPEAQHLGLGWQPPDATPERSDAKRKPSEWISIKQVRAAIEFSTLTRGRGRQKVIVIHPAQRMQAAAANALLKLLEEPQGGQRFVLCCDDPAALLPTVRSRCHALTLPTPDPVLAARWLAEAGLPGAETLLAASGGAPLAALERHALGLDAALWEKLPALVAAGHSQALQPLPLPLAIESLHKLCHDAMLCACGVPPRYFAAGSVPADGDIARLAGWGDALRRATRNADHPWIAALMVESLVRQGQRALGRSRDAAGSAPAGRVPVGSAPEGRAPVGRTHSVHSRR